MTRRPVQLRRELLARVRPRRGALRPVCLLVVLLLSGCGNPDPTLPPAPTPRTTAAPITTPTPMPGGPLTVDGPVGRGSHETPAGFVPAFTFTVRADDWRTIGGPDELGFFLITPRPLDIQAVVVVAKPVAATPEAFEAELEAVGFPMGDASVASATVGGVAARSYRLVLPEAMPGFRIEGEDGEIETSLGGDLSETRFVYVAHPDAPFVVLASLAPTGDPENRFVVQAFLDSITFH